ncbi:hypothetical protein PV327_000246 [Microctonus hyperodae]|uniref:AAA+ ATPase domain-containing protein n=1 Tax=Microctonus hyperodae TaxID=165561 RepID=A0AA39G6N4_MICHY|nr:hypothetical protein PV327_000246 [Microctonus hyperodae]
MEFDATQRFKSILLTGPPGIGKTTVCKKIIKLIDNSNYTCDGFYTEEIRLENRKRIGFDVIPINNINGRGFLARIESALEGKKPSKFRVGNYQVFVDEFELVALPCLESQTDVLIIDEIGKMELFSKRFHDCVDKLFWNNVENKPLFIIGTIPEKNRIPQRYIKLFEKFYRDGNCKIVDVNIQNRDKLPEMLLNIITNSITID